MQPKPPCSLRMPAFLHGSLSSVQRSTRAEGRRCAEQYRQDGSLPSPRELLAVTPGEAVRVHEVVDFQREQPAWRLYMVSNVMSALGEALDWQNTSQVRLAYEELCLQTAWGALYFTLAQPTPMSAERMARRLQAVLHFWGPLQSARYLFSSPSGALHLEDLMSASCGWVMEAWCPLGETSVRGRLELAARRMSHATREDCLEAILRMLPRALDSSQGLRHRALLVAPVFVRQRLASLDSKSFERLSSACPAELLGQLQDWDEELEVQ